MTRIPRLAFVVPPFLLGLGLVVAATMAPGCRRDAAEPQSPTTKTATDPAPAIVGPELFEGWTKPDAAIVLSGQMLGYLEPCGCSADQKGGLGRRYSLIESIRDKGWPTVAIDLGQLLNDPNVRGGPAQTRVKADIALKALQAMGYEAFGLAPGDLRIGAFEALGQYLQYEKPKAVAANVIPDGSLDSALVKSIRLKVGPFTIGVTAAIDADAMNRLNDPAVKDLFQVVPAEEVLGDVLADLEKDTDFQILLANGEPEAAPKLAEAFPGFDFVLAASHYPEPPDVAPKVVNDGKTQILTVGRKGMHVGVLGLYKGGEPRYQDVVLTKQGFEAAPTMVQLIDEDFQATLRDESVVADYPRRDHPSGAEFVGAKACRQCHPLTFAKWEKSKHSHAFESLLPRKRTFDAECISCHATGLEYTSGFRSAETTPLLKGNQCENCHGPGSKHVANPGDQTLREALQITADRAEKTLCLRCHDDDNSPKFNFATYWGQIEHKGLDKY